MHAPGMSMLCAAFTLLPIAWPHLNVWSHHPHCSPRTAGSGTAGLRLLNDERSRRVTIRGVSKRTYCALQYYEYTYKIP